MIKKIFFLILLFTINNCFAVDYPKALIVEHAGDTYAGDYTSPDGDFAPAKERHKEGYTGTYIYEGMVNGFPYWVQNGCIGEFVIKECRCYIYKQDRRWVLVPQPPNTSGELYGRTDDWLANAYNNNEWPWEGKWAGNVKSITINNDIDLAEARKKAKFNSCPGSKPKEPTFLKDEDIPKALIIEHGGDEYGGDNIFEGIGGPKGNEPEGYPHAGDYTGTYIYEGTINGLPYWVQNRCIGEHTYGECRCYIYKQNNTWVLVPQPPGSDNNAWLANAYNDNTWPWEGEWRGDVNKITINNDIDLAEARKKAKINSCPSNDIKPEITNEEQIAKNRQFVEEQINMEGEGYLRPVDENKAIDNKPIVSSNLGEIDNEQIANSVNLLFEERAYKNGGSYQGEVKNGRPHGIGVLTFQGKKYIGEWEDGVPNGFGIKLTQNELYIGQFKNSMKNGKGEIFKIIDRNSTRTMNSRTYDYVLNIFDLESDFNIDGFNVKNVHDFAKDLINKDLRSYEGNFKNDVKHGTGRIWYDNKGSMYYGNFAKDQPSGQGKKSFTNGDFYHGEFKEGKPHGEGSLESTDGSQYVGQFVDGIANGRGTKFFANKTSYTGDFKDGVANGKGTFKDTRGRKLSGTWKNGKLIKRD
jgi:hypothetical protein